MDDNPAHRKLFSIFLAEGWENVEVDCYSDPNPDVLLEYDGVVLDQMIGTKRGMEVARALHAKNWRLPMIILSMMPETNGDFLDAYYFVDYVVNKDELTKLSNAFQAWIRKIAVVNELKAIHQ